MKKPSPDHINAQTKDETNDKTNAQTKAHINAQIDDVLLQLWQKNLPTIRERLDLLDQFGSAAASGMLDESTRIEALNLAHKLAGSLGMYGYQEGTEVASKMERILKSPTPETLATLHSLATDLRKSLAAGL
ncbi:MAG TPA: Hpt domain-containing protein [Edaphobacter sp.]|jgi:HPt (histidine-containing phosphotransfer) domain-containing protein|nr:Hpt domain-containing protein [Edaphobacter sp.]